MVARGEEELICDLAEVYHVYDWRTLPLKLAATLAAGLPEDCRSNRKRSGQRVDNVTWMLAAIIDLLRWLKWSRTEDGANGRNYPDSLLEVLTQGPKPKPQGFRTAAEFDAAYQAFTGGG